MINVYVEALKPLIEEYVHSHIEFLGYVGGIKVYNLVEKEKKKLLTMIEKSIFEFLINIARNHDIEFATPDEFSGHILNELCISSEKIEKLKEKNKKLQKEIKNLQN